jgi:putative transposase
LANGGARIEVHHDDVELLRRLLGAASPDRLRLRVRIVLHAARGVSNREIARRLGLSEPTVGRWVRRFAEAGVNGLWDAPRTGRPRSIDDHAVNNLRRALDRPPPQGDRWSVGSLARTVGLPRTTVRRLCDAYTIDLSGALTKEDT